MIAPTYAPRRRWTAVDTLLVLFVLVTFGLGCALLGQVVQDEWRERHPAKPPVEQVTPSTPGAPAYGA